MRFLPALFAFALFCAAFLSFSVQPILGKMLLPMVGGAPAAWIVALAFFQLSLLAGYGISYGLGRLPVLVHAGGLVVLYAAGLFFLPPQLPEMDTTVRGVGISAEVISMLFKTVFVPFLALTSTTAALQRIFSATKHETANDPYYLFVASNLGSFVGLFAFPFFFEPFVGMNLLARYWQLFYVVAFGAVGVAFVAAWHFKSDKIATVKNATSTAISKKLVFKWLMLAFVPCSLSMGVTTLITTDIGGLPLFWVLPLGLYLLTFILAFARRRLVATKTLFFWQVVAVVISVFALDMGRWSHMGGGLNIFMVISGSFLAIFFIIAWACHQQLADLRPSSDRLTLYYFILALGGGLAGILHAFVIPFVLNDVIEFSLMVVLSLALHPDFTTKKIPHARLFYAAAIVSILSTGMIFALKTFQISHSYVRVFMILSMLGGLLVALTPRLLLVVGLLAFLAIYPFRYEGKIHERDRNFFGAMAVYDKESKGGLHVRYFSHGNTLHGMALLSPGKYAIDRHQISYYGRGNPIENILDLAAAKTVATIGLGAGQMACYRASMTMDFYEIDPHVKAIADTHFPYLKDCPVRDVIIGDGRLELSRGKRKYDVILLDAFTSDGIPIHLITREAVQTYRKHLTKNGVILYHVSNRYLNLALPLASIATAENLVAYKKFHIPSKKDPLEVASAWVAIPQTVAQGQELEDIYNWKRLEPSDNMVWTDDQSSVLQALSMKGVR